MYRYCLSLFWVLWVLPVSVFSQEDLFIEKPPFQRIKLEPGDSLRLRMDGEEYLYGYRYYFVRDSMLFTRGDSLLIRDIVEIQVERGTLTIHWLGQVAGVMLQAAIFYPVMVIINRPFRFWESKHYWQTGGIIAGGLLGFKLVSASGRWKKYKLDKGRWRLGHRLPLEKSVLPQGR